MPSCAGFLEPRKSRLGPSKSTFNAKKFIRSLSMSISIIAIAGMNKTVAAVQPAGVHNISHLRLQLRKTTGDAGSCITSSDASDSSHMTLMTMTSDSLHLQILSSIFVVCPLSPVLPPVVVSMTVV